MFRRMGLPQEREPADPWTAVIAVLANVRIKASALFGDGMLRDFAFFFDSANTLPEESLIAYFV